MSAGYTEKVKKLGDSLGLERYYNSWSNDPYVPRDVEAELAEIAVEFHMNISDVEEEMNEHAEIKYQVLMGMVVKTMGNGE